MTIGPEIWIAAIYGALLLLAGLGKYLTRQAPPNPLFAGIGMGYVDREQMERLITEIKRIADAFTDKNTENVTDHLEEQSRRIDSLMKALEVKAPAQRQRLRKTRFPA